MKLIYYMTVIMAVFCVNATARAEPLPLIPGDKFDIEIKVPSGTTVDVCGLPILSEHRITVKSGAADVQEGR